MNDARHNTQGRRSWFERHTQLLKQHNADAILEEAGNNTSVLNEVIITNYIYYGQRIYMRNAINDGSLHFPGTSDFMACNPQAVNIKRFDGQEAIICLKDGRLIVRVIKKSKNRGCVDLHNIHHGPDPVITPEVDICWAAPLSCTMPYFTWDKMMASGHVKILRNLHCPEGADHTTAG